MEGEDEKSDKVGSFSQASIPKRIAIVAAGAFVNIAFGLLVFLILVSSINGIKYGLFATKEFLFSIGDSLKMLFTGNIGVDQMMGPVGISEVVAKTSGIREFIYMLALISVSLGITNLLPIPALDGGKILLLIIEAIRRKPLDEKLEINLQLIGFSILIAISLYVTYNDIIRIKG